MEGKPTKTKPSKTGKKNRSTGEKKKELVVEKELVRHEVEIKNLFICSVNFYVIVIY